MAQYNIEKKLKELSSFLGGCKTSLSEIEKGDTNQERYIRICRAKLQSACSCLEALTKNLEEFFCELELRKYMDDSDFLLEVEDIN